MKRIMIIDDSLFMRKMLTDIVSSMGHSVIGEGGNGKYAVSNYLELRPDLIIMDINMPEMNGLDAVKLIIDMDPEAKILMCSALSQQRVVIESFQAGAKDFIVKPFEPDKIKQAISKITTS